MNIKKFKDERGELIAIEKLPFEIKRVYYLHNITEGATRGGHAHRKTFRLMLPVVGSFKFLSQGIKQDFCAGDSCFFIPPMVWCQLKDFSPDAVVMFMASTEHDESDCIRDYQEYLRLRKIIEN